MVANIEKAISTRNDKELRLSAHSIKGALTHLGAGESAKLAMKLEEMAAVQDMDNVDQVFQEFSESLHPLTEEMTQFMNSSCG